LILGELFATVLKVPRIIFQRFRVGEQNKDGQRGNVKKGKKEMRKDDVKK